VFLNTDYKHYLLADSNPDLINLYRQLSLEGKAFVRYCRTFFTPANNEEQQYYRFRQEFNETADIRRKSALFLYLNRHCYNGLVRYNSRGMFNTPFGRYAAPYFPEREMNEFIRVAGRAEFINTGFQDSMKKARLGDVIYCDPPYVPMSATARFTDYHTGGFS
jgi:DNA adenine methylase